MTLTRVLLTLGLALLTACSDAGRESPSVTEQTSAVTYDVIIRGGTIYDGSGNAPYTGDLAIRDDRIAALGDLGEAGADIVIDATGKAVSPGFINMMGWGVASLIKDGRGMSDVTQGITLEVFGEGISMGPLNDAMKEDVARGFDVEVAWTTLDEYLVYLAEDVGVSPNVASFIGATTPRVHVLGSDNVAPTEAQLAQMQDLVRDAMRDGALGVASSLIYTPGNFASTEELIALSKAAGEFGGIYISHMRNEGKNIFEALDELLTIAREAGVPAEIYHLKMAHKNTWDRFPELVEIVEAAQAEGLKITADMYPYPAGSTGLDAIMPPWANEGGFEKWVERMQDPATRKKLKAEMAVDSDDWENMLMAGGAEGALLVGFRNPDLQKYVGKTLAEVSEERGTDPRDTAMDLVIEDGTRVSVVYFTQSEDVVRQAVALPWTSFCTDSQTVAAEGEFLSNSIHPRGYGSFPRILGKYVREEGLLTLQQAIRKASALPAENLSIRERGRLEEGYYADVLVFDPETIIDKATFENPHQYSVGMEQVFVNGEQVIANGEHTGGKPGRVVRGPGWTGW